MNNIRIFKPKIIKELIHLAPEEVFEDKKTISMVGCKFIRAFLSLTPKQRFYILKTIENLKKYHL